MYMHIYIYICIHTYTIHTHIYIYIYIYIYIIHTLVCLCRFCVLFVLVLRGTLRLLTMIVGFSNDRLGHVMTQWTLAVAEANRRGEEGAEPYGRPPRPRGGDIYYILSTYYVVYNLSHPAYHIIYIIYHILLYLYGRFPDSIYGNGCGAENWRKHTLRFEKNIGVTPKQHIPPCVRIA